MQACNQTTQSQLKTSWRPLAVFLTCTFAIASIGSLITEPALVDWYVNLEKPSFTPPGYVFGIAWSFLYSTMAVAMWRVWLRKKREDITLATVLYHTQLGLNLFWTIAFFGMHNPALALIDIFLLQLANIATTICFAKIEKLAGLLFLPYVLWISFATVLNFYIWISN